MYLLESLFRNLNIRRRVRRGRHRADRGRLSYFEHIHQVYEGMVERARDSYDLRRAEDWLRNSLTPLQRRAAGSFRWDWRTT